MKTVVVDGVGVRAVAVVFGTVWVADWIFVTVTLSIPGPLYAYRVSKILKSEPKQIFVLFEGAINLFVVFVILSPLKVV